VNKNYILKGQLVEYGRSLANLIGSSSRHKSIQQEYIIHEYLIKNLQTYRNDFITLSSTLFALSGLVYLNAKNQSVIGNE
jgi:hypothetical protein